MDKDLEKGASEIAARYDLTCRMLVALIDDHDRIAHTDDLTGDAYAIAAAVLVRSMSEFLSSRGSHNDDWRATDFVGDSPGYDIASFDKWVNKSIAHATHTDPTFIPAYPGLMHSLVAGMSRFVSEAERQQPDRARWFYDVQARWQRHPICQRAPLRSEHDTVRGNPNTAPTFAWQPPSET